MKKNKLTVKQNLILSFICDTIFKVGRFPTYSEISEEFGFKSTNASYEHVRALRKKGYLYKGRNGRLEIKPAIRLLFTSE